MILAVVTACSSRPIGFLKVADHCPACGEELFHHRADDFPAYVVIVLVGHIVVPLMLLVETEYTPPPWFEAAFWPALTLGLALAFIQPIKGAIVAIQWYGQIHGFGQPRSEGAVPDRANAG